MHIMLILLVALVLAALWSVMTASIIRAAIALALTSAVLTVIMFQMNAPLAGVFELSVCAGLISVVFISVISLTHRLPHNEYMARRKSRIQRFWPLPILVGLVALALFYVSPLLKVPATTVPITKGVRVVMWDDRRLDLFCQIIVLLVGVYGVMILFRENPKSGN